MEDSATIIGRCMIWVSSPTANTHQLAGNNIVRLLE